MLNSSAVLGVGGAGSAFASVIGLLVVLLLIGAVWWGVRRRRAEPAPPRPGEQPRRPARRHIEEPREADRNGFPADGGRRTAHEMKGYGNFGSQPRGTVGPDDR
ncbi:MULTISPECIES: DUF6479 family protein [unclassified Streptomyces]|uniref:DUF6479 family protein n=1 Tax=unclassified Streptomyces TaxID=2593676 RepID=UPI001BE9BCB6|nr:MULTISPECIES: DUF6479 family protein [unclassified Streptomyces]MBT2407595.1 hypothetical protein [Streptomyces sp. ISL-21]MBT2459096.1 hypothetical protein [Streptomyces sp. ISL-86]MBT2611589.1 hypothetical protein [Streptomyces sp. ISL-87]